MAHAVLEIPKACTNVVKSITEHISTWHCVRNIACANNTITWSQDKFYGPGAESLSAFIAGLRLGMLPNKLSYKVVHDDSRGA